MEAVVALCCLLVALLLVWMLRGQGNTLPIPKGVPVFGNLLQIINGGAYIKLAEWAKELGPIFQIKMLHRYGVIVNDYDGIHTVLVAKAKEFGGRPRTNRSQYLWEYGRSIFVNDPNPEWKFLRNALHSKVKMYDSGLLQVEKVNMSVIQDLVKEFRNKDSEVFDPKDHVYKTVVNIICVFLLGRKYNLEDEVFKLVKFVERRMATTIGSSSKGIELDIFWWLRHFGNKNFKKLKELKEARHRLWQLAKADIEDGAPDKTGTHGTDQEGLSRGIIGTLLDDHRGIQRIQSRHHQSVSEHTIMLVFHELIFAGTATTTNSFYAFLNILIQHPQVQQKLREEVDKIVGADRQVRLSDRSNMPYTRAVILEVLRYISVVPLGVSHCTLTSADIKGHRISKGTRVIANLWTLHHDEDFWGDPFCFRPERFLDAEGNLLPADHVNRKHLMPFGAGLRVCLGESLALGRLFLLVSTMAQMFIMKPGPQLVSCDPRDYIPGVVIAQPNFQMEFTVRNKNLFL